MEAVQEVEVEQKVKVPTKHNTRGVWIEMADGQEWRVPFMPVGPKAVPLLKMLTEIENLNKRLSKVIKDAQEAAEVPAETDGEDAEAAQWDAINDGAEPAVMTQKNFEFGHAVLQLNYPQLDVDTASSLFDLISFSELVNVFTGIRRM